MEKNYVSLDDRMPLLEVVADGIVSKMGDVTIALSVDQPEIFTLGANDYERLHQAWVKAIRLLPPGTVVHMQEIYRKSEWKPAATDRGAGREPPAAAGRGHGGEPLALADRGAGEPGEWLSAASNRFFDGRPTLRHECRLYLTRRPAGRAAVNSATSGLLRSRLVPAGTFDAREQQEFGDIVQQMSRVLADTGLLKITRIGAEDLASGSAGAGIIEQYYWLSERDGPVIRDIRFDDGLQVGNRHGVLYALADADELPERCSPAVEYGPYSSENARLYVGFTAGLGLLLSFDHIVNRYIVVEDPVRALARIEKRRLRLHSLARYSRSNAVAAEALNAWLGEAASGQLTPCRMHLNVLAWVEDPAELRALRSAVVAAIAAMGAAPHEETVGLPQLWWAGIPGNAAELPENECFDTCLEQACCFLGMETNYRSLGSSFGIRLGDRLTGLPVEVDMDVEPRRLGWTGNNNLFVLSGSGGGKSFFMAHLCRTYHEWGMHTVVVDVGRSYETLCRLLGGAYITYEEETPIAFNPFFIGEGRLPDVEKKEGIKSLVLGLWKRSDEDHFRSEYITISNAVTAYYRMLAQRPEVFPCFDSFYEYMQDVFLPALRGEGVGPKVFDSGNFLYVLRPYYRGGEFDFLLNAREDPDLSSRPFIVFELRNIVGHPILFMVVTMVIVEVFMAKVRTLRGTRKMIVIEEAWKAIANAGMAGEIRGWVKTLRKHMGKLALVSQELEDIIDSPIIKQAVINSSDTKILLDQSKFAGRFGEIQAMLGLSDRQKAEVLSINKGHWVGGGCGGGGNGRPYKDVWIGLGPAWSRVYRLEVSEEEYLAYTSEEADKVKIEEYARKHGGLREGIGALAEEMRNGMRKTLLIVLLAVLSIGAKAQIPIIGIIGDAAKAIVMALDLKVQELQTETIGLQEAQQALENSLHLSELGDIAGWLQQQRDLYAGYYSELWQVKGAITAYQRVKDMIAKEAAIVAEVRQLNVAIGQDGHFTPAEVGSMGVTLAGILQAAVQNLGQIQQVITALVVQLDDADRLAMIDAAGSAIDRNYADLQVFGQRGLVLSLNRAKDANDMAAVKALWGIP